MKTYTVFIRQADNTGTTFITAVEAANVEHATTLACAECAEAWETDDEDFHILGVAAGDVEILEWDDQV